MHVLTIINRTNGNGMELFYNDYDKAKKDFEKVHGGESEMVRLTDDYHQCFEFYRSQDYIPHLSDTSKKFEAVKELEIIKARAQARLNGALKNDVGLNVINGNKG